MWRLLAKKGLTIDNWINTRQPTLNGKRLNLNQHETSRSLAIHPDGQRFALGAEWYLRVFDKNGRRLWARPAPSVVWAVNITGDGRMVVAAYGDGTIRWHNMENGRELMALMPLADQANWVVWTPEGFYGATPGAHGVLQWHVNRGWDKTAEAFPLSQFRDFRRPEALPLVLQEMDTARAIGISVMARAAHARCSYVPAQSLRQVRACMSRLLVSVSTIRNTPHICVSSMRIKTPRMC